MILEKLYVRGVKNRFGVILINFNLLFFGFYFNFLYFDLDKEV